MLDTYSTGTMLRRHGRLVRQKPKETEYLEIVMAEVGENSFYKGFGEQVTGIFLSTYDLKPIGTPVDVCIKFPDSQQTGISGIVEWIREHQPMIPENEPGLGIKILSMESATTRMIEAYLVDHPSLFFEGDSAISSRLLINGRDPVALQPFYSSTETEVDTFYGGLTTDIQAYVNNRHNHYTPSITRIGHTVEAAPHTAAQTKDALAVKAIATHVKSPQFHGGFTARDTGPKLFIETTTMRSVGTILEICIEMPWSWSVRGTGVVKWARKRNPLASSLTAPPGLGVCLKDINPSVWHNATCGSIMDDNCLICEEILPSSHPRSG